MWLLTKLRDFDAYTKPLEDFRIKTLSGGLVTLIAAVAMVSLAITETAQFLSFEVVEQLYVDSTTSDVRVDIHFDITFPRLPCPVVTVDVMDVSYTPQDHIDHDIYKIPLDSQGNNITSDVIKLEVNSKRNKTDSESTTKPPNYCGSCYGAAEGCCNTCEEVKHAYELKGWQVNLAEVEQCKGDKYVKMMADSRGQGCRVYGKVEVAKISGNFHIAPGEGNSNVPRAHVHDLHSLSPSLFDVAHKINHLTFGSDYPGKKNPLNEQQLDAGKAGVMYVYEVKVIPTMYSHLSGKVDLSHQFSVTSRSLRDPSHGSGIPGLFFQYEFSPLVVQMEERRKPLISFLVSLCAIIGGIFTVAQLVDMFIYSSSKLIAKKLEANKLG